MKKWDPDKFEQEAIEAWERRGPGVRRYLRKGEAIAVPEVGLPDAYLVGTGVQVYEYADGTLEPIFENLVGLLRAIAQHLVASVERPLRGDEAAFLRSHLGMTQAELAPHLGLTRESLSRHENSALFPVAESHTLRFLAFGSMLRSMSDDERRRMEAIFEDWPRVRHQKRRRKVARPGQDIRWIKSPRPQALRLAMSLPQ